MFVNTLTSNIGWVVPRSQTMKSRTSVAGKISAAPIPIAARHTISWPGLPACEAKNDVSANSARPICNGPLRPKRSPMRPAAISRPAKTKDVSRCPISVECYHIVITMKSSSHAASNMIRATPAQEYVEPMAELDDVGILLLDAAANLLTTAGTVALSTRRIAADAGMSTMNVYSRFGSKEGVVERLFINGFELLAAGMNGAPTTADPLADLRGCRSAYRQFAAANPTPTR